MTVFARVMSLLLAAIVIELIVPQDAVVATYRDVPAEVAQVTALEWREGAPPREVQAAIERKSGVVRVHGPRARQTTIVFARGDGRYLIDGPFAWPPGDQERDVPREWRRTVSGSVPPGTPSDGAVDWIAASAENGPWPRCMRADAASWQCLGVGAGTRGVITLDAPDGIRWSVIGAGDLAPLRRAQWGRLLIIDGVENTPPSLKAAMAFPVPPPPERLVSARLETAPVAGAQSAIVSDHALWIAGPAPPPAKSWVEVRTDEYGPAYLSLPDLADGPRVLPIHVRLLPRRTVSGRVTSADGTPAASALLTIFRAIDPLPATPGSPPPRRVLTAEMTAKDDGEFVVEGLGEADYEIVAFHSQFGRASVNLESAQTNVTLALQPPGMARGRVVAAGKPLAGIDIISVPDRATFNAARDVTEIKGGDARTAADGRFSVVVASTGGGELRISGGPYAVRRVPLPRPAVPLVDLGDIELVPGIDIKIVFDRAVDGCTLRAVGPIGRTGMQIVTAVRNNDGTYGAIIPEPGLWQFGLACAVGRHPLSPASVQITPAHAGKEVPFVVK
jgi:hypothetical protein